MSSFIDRVKRHSNGTWCEINAVVELKLIELSLSHHHMDLSDIVLYVIFKAFKKTIFRKITIIKKDMLTTILRNKFYVRKKTLKKIEKCKQPSRSSKSKKIKKCYSCIDSSDCPLKLYILVDVKAIHDINCVNFE